MALRVVREDRFRRGALELEDWNGVLVSVSLSIVLSSMDVDDGASDDDDDELFMSATSSKDGCSMIARSMKRL